MIIYAHTRREYVALVFTPIAVRQTSHTVRDLSQAYFETGYMSSF
jgi:hypothetical protein